MNVLVFNCGSSSLKFRLIRMPEEEELTGGEAQRVGPVTAEPSRIVYRRHGEEETVWVEMRDHAVALTEVMKLLERDPELVPHALGQRVVHGGTRFTRSVVLDDGFVADLNEVKDLAPIHNPPAMAVIEACRSHYPDLPQVGVFDTAYHATIPDYARTYALPASLREDLAVRKYGFHGTSHRFVAEEAARFLGKPLESLNAVSAHLGSGGASLCAIVNGRSVDNTMGYSPLQGLVMSTRSGDLDPAVVLRLMGDAPDAGKVEDMLNKQSGLLGLSARSSDIRDILSAGGDGVNANRMRMTAQVYLWRIRKYLGAYLAVVGEADAVIFTDTIGEKVPDVPWAVCSGMEIFGLAIDAGRNVGVTAMPADVSTDSSRIRILVIRTNEELAIARETVAALREAA